MLFWVVLVVFCLFGYLGLFSLVWVFDYCDLLDFDLVFYADVVVLVITLVMCWGLYLI